MGFDLAAFRRCAAEPTRNNEGWYCCGCGEDMTEAADEIARLTAIVDKLPKTADGVTVVPGMLLYHYATGRPLGNVVTYTAGMRAHGQWAVAAYPVGDCYSTREAAEAAGGE